MIYISSDDAPPNRLQHDLKSLFGDVGRPVMRVETQIPIRTVFATNSPVTGNVEKKYLIGIIIGVNYMEYFDADFWGESQKWARISSALSDAVFLD